MRKEKTPIEELIERIKEEKAEGILFDLQMLDELQEKEIRFIKAKVLEALEREVPKAYLSWYEGIDDLAGDKYYKTEVKPNYKL
jgi:hypothetical protein